MCPAKHGRRGILKLFPRKREELIVGSTAVVLFFTLWEAVVRGGLIDPFFLSPPSSVFVTYVDLFVTDRSIYPHLLTSFYEGAMGLALTVGFGIPVGILMGRVRLARLALEPFMMALYSTPVVALLPVLILWFGIGFWSKVVLIFLGGFFAVAINTQAGVAHTDARLIETARSFTAREYQILAKIVLPSAVPFIIAGIRLAVGRILIMVVVAEMYAAMQGVGFLIMRAGASADTPVLFAGVILLAVFGVVLSRLLTAAQRKVAPWLVEGYE
jgi:ABC-type nitrate/sulfonate/bicarbonate transport system permease component